MTQVRISIKLRNEHVIAARERLGLTQAQLAELVDTQVNYVGAIERFDYSHKLSDQIADRIAGALDLNPDDVMPPEMRGTKMPADFQRTVNADPARLAEISHDTTRFLSFLRPTERKVIEMRYGLGRDGDCTLEETGRELHITRERVRQIECRAIRTMQAAAERIRRAD